MITRSIRRHTIYASLYRMPDDRLKAHMIFIVGANGELEDYFPGPLTIGEYFGNRLKREDASVVVCDWVKDSHPRMKIGSEDVKLYSLRKAVRLLFQLENR